MTPSERVGRSAVLFLVLLALVAVGSASAQQPSPQSFPNLDLVSDGSIGDIVRLPDGAIVVAGSFSRINGVARANIARLSANGTVDPLWNPGTNGLVETLAVDASGAVYAGGYFSRAGGLPRANIAKFSGSGTGAVDPDWNPSANDMVRDLAVHEAGASIVVCGYFTEIGGQARNTIAKLSLSGAGAADPVWDPALAGQPGASADVLVVDDVRGEVIVGGLFFSSIGGQPVGPLARLDLAGTGQAVAEWGPLAATGGMVYSLAMNSDTRDVYVGGSFFMGIGGQPFTRLAKVSGTGAGEADPIWNPDPDQGPRSLVLGPGDSLFVGGAHLSIGGESRHGIAKVSAIGTGAVDPDWDAAMNEHSQVRAQVRAIAPDDAGGLHVGGFFETVGGLPRRGLVRLDASGAPGPSTDVLNPGNVRTIVRQPDGGAIVGGDFELQAAGGVQRRHLLRLRPDGLVDPDWNPSPNGAVEALVADPVTGAIYVAGGFSQIGGLSRSFLARVEGTGAGLADPAWNPAPGGYSRRLALAPTGDWIYLAGWFTSVGGQQRNQLAKLATSGTGEVDPLWSPAPNVSNAIESLTVDPDSGDVFIAGSFSAIDDQPRTGLARLSGTGAGTPVPSWNPMIQGSASQIGIDAGTGAVFVAGPFTAIDGQPRGGLAKLDLGGTGALDALWAPEVDGTVYVLVVDPIADQVYVGGDFIDMSGGPASHLVRFASSGAGGMDTEWLPDPDAPAWALVIDPTTGRIHVGGRFSRIGTTPRNGIAVLLDEVDPVFVDGAFEWMH